MYIAPVGSRSPYRRANSLAELLSWHDVDFVRCAYVTIVGRPPDPQGEAYYTDRIRRGHSPMELLWQLRRSAEGRRHDPGIAGLDRALKKARWRRNRWIGWILAPVLGGEGASSAWQRNRILINQLGRLQNSLDGLATSNREALVDPGSSPQAAVDLATETLAPEAPAVSPASGHEPMPASAPSAIVELDADRMVPAGQWRAITEALFRRHWPEHSARVGSAIDGNCRLWVATCADQSATVSSETLRSVRALRDAASFGVEVGSLGPRVPGRAKTFAGIEELAEGVAAEDLVFFVGPKDQIDPRLADALIIEHAWEQEFILTDQYYTDGARVAPLLFHAIDHYHLAHADYIFSRFLMSGKMLREAVNAGAACPVDAARYALNALRERPGKRLHLQYPFLGNGDLDLNAARRARRRVMQELAADPVDADAAWDDSVSVIISTKDGGYLLDGLISQLLAIPRITEILVVSNNTSGDYTLDLLDRLSHTDRVRVFRYDRPFNFSVQTNRAAREAKGAFLLIMNDDVTLIGSNWLDRLLSDVDTKHARIAGPLLLYPNQSIQQGGMYLGHNHRAGHTFRHQRHPHDAPMFELVAPRLVSCITGACMLMKRSLFEDLNGFDEQLATGLQDVDLCLRALYSGAELVFDPRSIIFHLESVSLIPTLSDESVQRRRDREYARFRDRWDSELRPDRWHNRNFYIEDEALRHLRIAD